MDFFEAVEQGNEEEVSRLLDANPALLESENMAGKMALTRAAQHGHLGVVKLLLERGADMEALGGCGWTALVEASLRGHEAIVALLLSKGAQSNTASIFGNSPLMLASSGGFLGVVRLLLLSLGGRGLDRRNGNRSTALHFAAATGRDEVMRFLLLAGADPTITDISGRTPCTVAEINEHHGSVGLFEWWEGELKRRPLLERARYLHDASTTHRDTPAAPVPAFLQARAAAGQALPQVEVVAGQQEEQQAGASSKRGASSEASSAVEAEEEEEVYAVYGYVVRQLNEALFTELMQGFHCKDT